MITVRVSKAVREDPAALDRLGPFLLACVPVADSIRQRVQVLGQPVGGFPGYSRATKYRVSEDYADELGIRPFWPNSAIFHGQAGVKAGTFDVSRGRGMWSGWGLANWDKNAVVFRFSGQSLGQSSQTTGDTYTRKVKGQEVQSVRRKPEMIPNSAKAGRIWSKMGRNVTQADDEQIASMHGAVVSQVQAALAKAFVLNGKPSNDIGNADLVNRIVSAWGSR